jgi:putative peptidoglycan lipid II flippase
MVGKIFSQGKKFITNPQTTVFSAAFIVMIMIITSRVLGLVRQRILANYFLPSELSLFFAAFRLPDLIFEILVFGTFSSAFIPVFTKALKEKESIAWDIAAKVVNIGLLIFIPSALIFGLLANRIYSVIAPGFTGNEILSIAHLARILFAAQGFFVISYVLTGVLESQRRFLVPALAPVFYNLGIILGTVLLSSYFGLTAPAIGVVIGALAHLLIQVPLARSLGFHFTRHIAPDEGVKKIGRLALPRVIDLSLDQIGKSVELYLASIISTASYTYYTFANSLQLLPVSLFGVSLAKAALPTLSRQADEPSAFRETLLTTMFQSIFLTAPFAVVMIVLRIPLVRLVYGTDIFDWRATVQTGMVLSAFAVGIVFQTLVAILGRSFFALHDTKTPVYVSVVGLTILVLGDFTLVKGFSMPVWALAVSFSVGAFVETICLYFLLAKRLHGLLTLKILGRVAKVLISSLFSGGVMYFLLKFFDRSVWVKRISFVGAIGNLPFERFVLDTRYTLNVLILTAFVAVLGIGTYLGTSLFLKSEELSTLVGLARRAFSKKEIAPLPGGSEPINLSQKEDLT